jgi:regulator-associated protein of mTOR
LDRCQSCRSLLHVTPFDCLEQPRHDKANRRPPVIPVVDFRNRDRLKTAQAALIVCLRLGYDPPDVVKTDPCAKLECWVDPSAISRDKALDQIGKNLQKQYESLASASKVKYRTQLDPSVEDTKKTAIALRRQAKGERVLYHYNGHGVPKPTASGEIWVFNRQYTQYIPVSLQDLLSWLGSPTFFVWDCSSAGNIVTKVQEFAARKDAEAAARAAAAPPPSNGADTPTTTHSANSIPPIPAVPFRETIQLAACQGNQTLPMNPDLPADLFTSCLTSPIEIALRFFILRNPLKADLDVDLAMKIPGTIGDRKTPLGELSWIFTAVTDTIAWNMLPKDLFQRLFRHDLVVAALFRGFILAERIMRHYDCTPISVPALPPTHNHSLWDSWDLAVDRCLVQLPAMLRGQRAIEEAKAAGREPPSEIPFGFSRFFSDQLTAFEMWLDQGPARTVTTSPSDPRPSVSDSDGTTRPHSSHPEQLPIVLQVLLSQQHRLRALILLCKFLDLGPWAVNLSLSIGIFPYVLKLLQAPGGDLKPVLIYIWARILGIYRGCQEELLRQVIQPVRGQPPPDLPYQYFVKVLASHSHALPIPNVSEHRAMCAFVLAMFCRGFRPGQMACLQRVTIETPRRLSPEGTELPATTLSQNVLEACLVHLSDQDPLLRQWSALCIAQLWEDFDEAKGQAIRAKVHEKFHHMLTARESERELVPEVRSAVLYALGTLIGTSGAEESSPRRGSRSLSAASPEKTGLAFHEQADIELGVAMMTLKMVSDGSPMVRRELVILLSAVVVEHLGSFVIAAYRNVEEEKARQATGRSSGTFEEERQALYEQSLRTAAESDDAPSSPAFRAMIFSCIYKSLLDLASDPYPEVAELACIVVDSIHQQLFTSPLASASQSVLDNALSSLAESSNSRALSRDHRQASDGSISSGLNDVGVTASGSGTSKRSALASAVRSLTHLGSASGQGTGSRNGTGPREIPSRRESGSRPSTAQHTPDKGKRHLHNSASAESLLQMQARSRSRGPDPSRVSGDDGQREVMSVEEATASLLAADEERLSMRKQGLTNPEGEPLPGFGRGGDETLPLRSDFFDCCSRYFTEPQMKVSVSRLPVHLSSRSAHFGWMQPPEADEPGSVSFNERLWRRDRSEKIILATQPLKEIAGGR